MTPETARQLPDSALAALQSALRGELLRPGDHAYDDARRIHNGMIDRHPALIVRCAGASDVISGVNFARDHQLPLSVRGGGHGVPGHAVCDGGLMLDLSRMRSVRVDPVNHTASAEGGTTWGDFDHETQAFGLATTGGIARPTGIAGLTLGGGHGWLMRKYGLACDNLMSADVVTAGGHLLRASAAENTDLFWGLRGGGGNFGVVTSFEYRLHPVGILFGGLSAYPLAKGREFLRLYRDFMTEASDEMGSAAVLGTLSNGAQVAALIAAWTGRVEEGERRLKALRSFASPVMDQIGPGPYLGVQSIVENFNPRGLRNYWKSSYLTGLSDGAIDVMVDRYHTVPSPHTHIAIECLGGAVNRVRPDETAVAHRDALYNLIIVGMWPDAAQDEATIAWVREVWAAMQPFSSAGSYINYLGSEADEGAERIRNAYGPEKYERLAAVKSNYDPANLFCLNQNIKPAAPRR